MIAVPTFYLYDWISIYFDYFEGVFALINFGDLATDETLYTKDSEGGLSVRDVKDKNKLAYTFGF
jgi:hypothetical protein